MNETQIFEYLEFMAQMVPAPFYWLDLEGRFIGLNGNGLAAIGTLKKEDVIGKNSYELYNNIEVADVLQKDINQVIETGKTSITEDKIIDVATGKYKYFSATRAPLYDKIGKIIGVIGTSIDITAEKELELRKNETQIFEYLEFMAQMVPAPFYWIDLDGRFIGLNNSVLEATGAIKKEDVIGKNVYELYNNIEVADTLQRDISQVITTGKTSITEDKIIDVTTGKYKYFKAIKAPLHDKVGKTIGVIGTSIDITAEKELELRKNETEIFEYLGFMAQMVPAPFYWLDLEGRFIGLNENGLAAIGTLKEEDVIGKNVYELYRNIEIADTLQKDISQVITTGQTSITEDKIIDVTTGKYKYFKAIKAPLHDKVGKTIGVIGTSIDITAEKEAEQLKHENRKLEAENKFNQIILENEKQNAEAEAEQLRLENEVHKLEKEAAEARTKEQENFRKVADRVAHDLRPPVASISSLAKQQAVNLPEEQRITLRDAANRVNDLANYLLGYYKPAASDTATQNKPEPLLISGAIGEILSEKRLQFSDLDVCFGSEIDQDGYFAFIYAHAAEFKSMLSNLINNSVDAFDGNAGIITVKLTCKDDTIQICIEDKGKGMSASLVNKIINNINVTEGKKNGHGIGLAQVRETLKQNNGKLDIDSKLGVGTKITLTFAKITPPAWVAEKIELNNDDIIIVIDDDPSIHGAWDSRFAIVAPEFKLKHFNLGDDAVKFINALSAEEKQKVFLLTDYELLEQQLNGLDIIAKTGIKRSILVTSCYEDKLVQEQAQSTNTKILPKLLALEIPILLSSSVNTPVTKQTNDNALLHVDMIIVDDYKPTTKNLKKTILQNKNVPIYNDVHSFLNDVYKYARDTKILLDNNYDNYKGDIKGIDIGHTGFSMARKLHSEGYTNLYLFSGDKFDSLPDYLKGVIAKHHYDDIEALLNPDTPPKSDKLVQSEILRELIVDFVLENYREQRDVLNEINYLAAQTKRGRPKSKVGITRLDTISTSARDVQNTLTNEYEIISQAQRMFIDNLRHEEEFLVCNLQDHMHYEAIRLKLKNNMDLYHHDIRIPYKRFPYFKYIGNRLIVDLVITLLLNYAASQIKKQTGIGSIGIDTAETENHNILSIKYTLQMLESAPIAQPSSFEDLPDYSENFELCKKLVSLFGVSISLQVTFDDEDEDTYIEFMLHFPRLKQDIQTSNSNKIIYCI